MPDHKDFLDLVKIRIDFRRPHTFVRTQGTYYLYMFEDDLCAHAISDKDSSLANINADVKMVRIMYKALEKEKNKSRHFDISS